MQKTLSHSIIAVCAVTLTAALVGCAGGRSNLQPTLQHMQTKEVMVPHPARASVDNDGSLWQVRSSLNGMFIDTKARNIGDIVTVEIDESAKASNKANTETGRTSSLEAGIEKLFGIEDWWQNQILPKISNDLPRIDPFNNPSVKGSMKSDFAGDGATTRSGTLSAFITCRVVNVMPNGNLKIVGTREVMVNNENQLIILSGIIRPRDISDENVIMSTFISDAKIAYSGSGIVDDRQRPGWLANLLNNVWPF